MERQLVLSKAFNKSYQKFTRKNHLLKSPIAKALTKLQKDIYDPSLRTHKLSGSLAALLACSCGYDCRILFTIEQYEDETEYILLLDIGTHDDVY